MRELQGYDPNSALSDDHVSLMPSNGGGWSSRTPEEDVYWDVSDVGNYATMRDIADAGWSSLNVKLSAFDEAGYSWERFSRMVGFFGVSRFGELVNPITSDAIKNSEIKTGGDLESKYARAATKLAGEIDDRLYTIGYYGISDCDVDKLLLLSLVLAPHLGAPFDWNSAARGDMDTEMLIALSDER